MLVFTPGMAVQENSAVVALGYAKALPFIVMAWANSDTALAG